MSDLVGNPEDRFSHNEAHLKKTAPSIKEKLEFTEKYVMFLYFLKIKFAVLTNITVTYILRMFKAKLRKKNKKHFHPKFAIFMVVSFRVVALFCCLVELITCSSVPLYVQQIKASGKSGSKYKLTAKCFFTDLEPVIAAGDATFTIQLDRSTTGFKVLICASL